MRSCASLPLPCRRSSPACRRSISSSNSSARRKAQRPASQTRKGEPPRGGPPPAIDWSKPMSNSRDAAAASGGARNSPPDTQALIGLLENLVPLLLHFQTQSFGPSGSGRIAGGHGAQLERQAAVTFTEDIILDAVRNLSGYLQKNANRYPGLEAYAGVVA